MSKVKPQQPEREGEIRRMTSIGEFYGTERETNWLLSPCLPPSHVVEALLSTCLHSLGIRPPLIAA